MFLTLNYGICNRLKKVTVTFFCLSCLRNSSCKLRTAGQICRSYYVNILINLFARDYKTKKESKVGKLLHDNAPVHKAGVAVSAIASNYYEEPNLPTIHHIVLAWLLSDCFLFSNMKKVHRQKRFEDEIIEINFFRDLQKLI